MKINTSREMTKAAKLIYKAIYNGDPWPRGWRVRWETRPANATKDWGEADPATKIISLDRSHAHQRKVFDTLIHEFTHIRNENLRHGKEFDRLVKSGVKKLDFCYGAATAADALFESLGKTDSRIS